MKNVESGALFEGTVSAPVRALVQRCIDGVASEDEVAELDRLVTTDPAAARELATAASLESSLEVLLRAQPGAGAPALTMMNVTALPARRRIVRVVSVAAVGIAALAATLALTGPLRRRRGGAETLIAERRKSDAPEIGTSKRAVAPVLPGTATPPPVADTIPVPSASSATALSLRSRTPRNHLDFADGSSAELRDDATRLETRVSKPRVVDLVLVQGAARFEVTHRPGRRFRIWVASAYVEVVGTVFSVERLGGNVRVSVERGLVKVVRGDKTLRLAGGTEQTVLLEAGEDQRLARSRSRRPADATSKGDAEVAVGEASALLQSSEDARREGRAGDAFVLLQRFLDRYHADSRAFYASFIEGRVLLEELARPREAAAAFARVEALNPRTELVQDALAREVESWCRAGDIEMARQRARAFLRRYPYGRRADEVRRYGQLE